MCRAEEIAKSGDFLVVSIGDQSVVVTRDREGALRAFHNTCRHRGSVLCTSEKGRFKSHSIVCPYHAWTYSLDGKLASTPYQLESSDFDMADYSLYEVAIDQWGGFVFINLAGRDAEPLEDLPLAFPGITGKLALGGCEDRLPVGPRDQSQLEAVA